MNSYRIRSGGGAAPTRAAGGPPGNKSQGYKTAPDKSGLAGFIQRCFEARKFISGRALRIRALISGRVLRSLDLIFGRILPSRALISARPLRIRALISGRALRTLNFIPGRPLRTYSFIPGRALHTLDFISGRILPTRAWISAVLMLAILLAAPATIVLADHPSPGSVPLEAVDYEQKLNAQVPLDLPFKDEAGNPVQLSQYFGRRPVVLLFAYYECPMLCTLVLNNLTRSLKSLQFTPGDQFEIVTVSIDPAETPELAAEKKAAYLRQYDRPGAERGWHFLTGGHAEIDSLAHSVGFRYVYDGQIDQYAHPSGVILLTPEGRVSRYILGIDYSPKDLRLGLVEAADRKIGTPVDGFFLLCYRYDPQNGSYTLVIENVIRLAGSATALALGGLIFWLLRREREAARSKQTPEKTYGRPQHG